jgi:uncharacterized membrane protein YraQ (UPF0718 family)
VPDALFDVIVAVGLGVMLRMVAHIHTPLKDTRGARAAGGIAFLAGIAGALAIPSPESVLELAQPNELSMASSVVPLFVATAPALLVGLLFVGLAHALTPRPSQEVLGRASLFAQAIWGVALGITQPAGAHPRRAALQKMLGERVPAATVVALGIAALELNAGGVAILALLIGTPIALIHTALGALLAVTLGVVAGRAAVGMSSMASPVTALPAAAVEERPAATPFLENAWTAANSVLDRGGAWYVAGIILAGALEAALPQGLGASAVPWGVPAGLALGAGLGALMRLPLLAAAPLAAVMIHKGFLTGAAIALLFAASFPWGAGSLELNPRRSRTVAAIFTIMGVAGAVIAGLAGDAALGSRNAPELHSLLSAERGSLAWGAASLLAALLAVSVVRLGPRAWIAAMLSPAPR